MLGMRLTHSTIPAMGFGLSLTLEQLSVGWLQILATRRLHFDNTSRGMLRPEASGIWAGGALATIELWGIH